MEPKSRNAKKVKGQKSRNAKKLQCTFISFRESLLTYSFFNMDFFIGDKSDILDLCKEDKSLAINVYVNQWLEEDHVKCLI